MFSDTSIYYINSESTEIIKSQGNYYIYKENTKDDTNLIEIDINELKQVIQKWYSLFGSIMADLIEYENKIFDLCHNFRKKKKFFDGGGCYVFSRDDFIQVESNEFSLFCKMIVEYDYFYDIKPKIKHIQEMKSKPIKELYNDDFSLWIERMYACNLDNIYSNRNNLKEYFKKNLYEYLNKYTTKLCESIKDSIRYFNDIDPYDQLPFDHQSELNDIKEYIETVADILKKIKAL